MSNTQTVQPTAAETLVFIQSNLDTLKVFAYSTLLLITDSELQGDTWIKYNEHIDLNIHDDDGDISIQAYPVVNDSVVTKEFVHVAKLNTYTLDFDAVQHFGHENAEALSPKEIAQTNVIEHLIKEIEHFKSLATAKDMVIASELFAIYEKLCFDTYVQGFPTLTITSETLQ